jgi:hypothetical protein
MSFIGSRSRVAACAPGAIPYSVSWHWRGALVLLLASAMMTPAFGKGSSTPPGHRHTPPHRSASSEGKHHTHGSVHKGERPELAAKSRILPDRASAHEAAATLEPSADLTATKQAIALLRHRKFSEAAALAATIDDPIARKLVEWVMLRDSDSPAGFDRYAAFIQANADWPSIPLLRRRAEATPVAGAAGGLNRPPFPWQATCQRDPGLCEPRDSGSPPPTLHRWDLAGGM